MKFEFDHRTGMMRPKKDEEIYFAQSQGGGLIVDDKKNNVKYIIERDGRITKLFGSFDKDNLNLYDMRDARIIADRVRRLLGVNHKYTDFHYFLRGYHMNESVIKKCSDFLGESIWSDIQDRSSGETVRKEDEAFYNNMSKFEFLDYLNSKYKDKVVKIEKWGSKINVQFNSYDTNSKYGCIQMYIEFIEYPYSEENKIKRIIITSSKPNNLLKVLKTRFIVKKMHPDNWYYEEGQEKPIWLVIDGEKNTVVDIFEFFLNNKLNESIWSDIQDRSAGETVRAEDVIIDNKTIKSKIKQLYIEQGEDDTLDVSSLKIYKCDDLSNLFYNFNRVKQIIGLETWDVSNVTDMRDMFNDCQNLTELNISNWDVSNVTNMNGMFIDCSSLTELNISNWDVSNVTDMSGMFSGCSSLIELNISTWDVSNVIDMYCMFKDCSSFTELNIDNWDVGNVTDMRFMFEKCESLTELNISNWDVSNATNMAYMFGYCKSLTELNISNWDVSKVTNMNSMFTDCSSLKELNIDTWDVSKVTYMRSMFNYCDKLIKPKWYKDE